MEKAKYTIKKVPNKTGKRMMFVPLVNGKRLSSTLFARKYDAKNLLNWAIRHHGHEKLAELAV